MIYELCNSNEQITTFNKLSFIKKSSLSAFNHLTSDDAIKTIITNLPDSAEALVFNLLPENLRTTYKPKVSSSGLLNTFKSNFVVTPQDRNLQDLLDAYNNEEGIAILEKYGTVYVYGSTLTPILFLYEELHSNKAPDLKGYTINLTGECIGRSKIFENYNLNIFTRGLAFELAGTL